MNFLINNNIIYLCRLSIAIFSIVSLTACNSDVFIDHDELDNLNPSTILLPAEDGFKRIEISTKQLHEINLIHITDDATIQYIDKAGNSSFTNIGIANLKEILCESPQYSFSLIYDGESISLQTHYNSQNKNIKVQAVLSYAYINRFITLEIKSGRPLELIECKYSDNPEKSKESYTVVKKMSAFNPADTTLSFKYYPTLVSDARSIFSDLEPWAKDIKTSLSIPKLCDNNDILKSDSLLVELNKPVLFEDKSWKIAIEKNIPPKSTLNIFFTVYFDTCKWNGTLLFRNPANAKLYKTNFILTALYPIRYEVRTECAD